MFYTIYKTTNIINGKFYIGKHQTEDLKDGYIGSGKLLQRAIKKYGIENFHKEILYVCKSEKHMNTLEKILVVPDVEINYNLCDGGKGGFGYINRNPEKFLTPKRLKGLIPLKDRTEIQKQNWRNNVAKSKKKKSYTLNQSASQKRRYEENKSHWLGKKHSEKTLQKMRKSKNVGHQNSQYGTCWITNGVENKKIKKEKLDFWLSKGYNKGRILPH